LNRKRTLVVPGCYLPQIETVRDSYFSNFNKADFSEYPISTLVVGRIVLYLGVVPSLLFGTLYFFKTWWALLFLGWIPVVWAAILRWYKIQSITLKQSPFQRRKHLATLTLSTAGGNLTLPYIPLTQCTLRRGTIHG